MNSRHLIDRFTEACDRGERMVLVTVFETLGSTYSKAGSRMLIMAGGRNQGLVSGGCLESDLAERAAAVQDAASSVTVTYDLRDEADELFGLGVGCNGLISVLLQILLPEANYEPMASIAEALFSENGGALATVVESHIEGLSVGASQILLGNEVRRYLVPDEIAAELKPGCESVTASGLPALVTVPERYTVLYAPLRPIPRVLILGAGLDAMPLVNVLAELGWRITVADHRPSYLARAGFERAESKFAVNPESLATEVALDTFDACVVMSHHLLTDLKYLRQLASCRIRYVGVLGPPARKQRLLNDLGDAAGSLAARLHGPVGLDIGADSAESIAVSIAAEMQSELARGA